MLRATRALPNARVFLSILVVMSASAAHSQTTAFTYQGQLSDAAALANGSYDLRFALFDAGAGGAQIGTNQDVPAVPVSAGVFTVQLDFGVNAFPGANRFVEIAVKKAGDGSFTTLAPRQQISSSPYAIRTLSAATADALSSACVGCVKDTQIQTVAGSKVSGAIPAASLPTGSGNYIQNTTTQQAGASFNIAGNGTTGGMNVNGAVSLGGISPPAPAPAGQGRIYFDTSSNKVKVSENGAAFVNLTGASGVSGSGTTNTIPLWSAGTTLGNSVISQASGNVGIGKTNPLSKLVVAPGGTGGEINFGTPSGETGMAIIGTNRADVRFDGDTLKLIAGLGPGAAPSTNGVAITTAGTVGIGTTTPTTGQLQVHSNNVGLPAIYGESANRGVWGHSTGSSRGVYGDSVSGEGVHGESTTGTGVAGLTAAANIASPGVGGASTGNGGVGVRGDGTTGVYGKSTSNSGVGVYGESSMGNAVYGISHHADFAAVAGQNDQGGYAMYAGGNAGQARGSGGWVKAMALIDRDGGVVRCYNSQLAGSAASTAPCGITAHDQGSGDYNVTFNFQVDDRFISVTASRDTDVMVANIGILAGNSVQVYTALNSETNDNAQNHSPAQFTIFVY